MRDPHRRLGEGFAPVNKFPPPPPADRRHDPNHIAIIPERMEKGPTVGTTGQLTYLEVPVAPLEARVAPLLPHEQAQEEASQCSQDDERQGRSDLSRQRASGGILTSLLLLHRFHLLLLLHGVAWRTQDRRATGRYFWIHAVCMEWIGPENKPQDESL